MFRRDALFESLFPNATSEKEIIKALQMFYEVDGKLPIVEVNSDWVSIELNMTESQDEKVLQKAILLCEQRQFTEAVVLLKELIENNPANSEYHRLLGQAYSEMGENDEAINHLIDALRWDSTNAYALVMMGNIFIKHKEDVEAARIYYDQALKNNPNDHITLSNIGATLLNEGKIIEGKEFLLKAIEVTPYPNALYSLGIISVKEGDLRKAFNYQSQALKNLITNDQLYQFVYGEMQRISMQISANDSGENIIEDYKAKLESRCGKNIKIEAQEDIPFAAKIEFAENYNRDFHLVKYKPSRKAVAHLVMHELVHLELVLDARESNDNLLFTSSDENKSKFRGDLYTYLSKLKKMGVDSNKTEDIINSLFDGFNSLIYNAPTDLFIEHHLFNQFTALRPHQFVSLSHIISEGIYAVTSKDLKELSPPAILSKTKILNLVAAFQFRNLFGVDVKPQYQASKQETDIAVKFYEEFLEYRDDKNPAEEYELIQHWAEDLQVDSYFKLVSEKEFRNKGNAIDDVLEKISSDPYNLNDAPEESEEMEKFLNSYKDSGVNLAVVAYMVEALSFFKALSQDKIKEIAFEIAMQGRQGYNPNGESYKLATVSNKTFTGYQILAYYYVSWALAIPEMLGQLQLPFEKEYQLAASFK